MTWRIETGLPGLYDVYDEDGNRVVSNTTIERARLIAAAPAMLAALEEQEKVLNSDGMEHSEWVACRVRARALLKAALATARGETPPNSETRQQRERPGG
jgi:hypothetical protein